jgi:virginiamycin B lyase
VIKRLLPLCYFITVLLLLSACSDVSQTPLNTTPSSATADLQTSTGAFQEYALPRANSGLMRPAIDHKGLLWFGEMGHNFLTSFDPQTQAFQEITPPDGKAGIMGIAAASDNTIWFAEQYANYIGHYYPETHTFQTYPLPTIKAPDPNNNNSSQTLPVAPNDIALDSHGNIWFTELNSDSIGMLDSKTGTFKHYQIGAKKTVQTFDPYGITVDEQDSIWFTESNANRLGHLDPRTGNIRFFTTPNNTDALMEVTNDQHGTIWATGFTNGLLVRFDTKTGKLTSYHAPGNKPGGIYGIIMTSTEELWLTLPAENALARFDTKSNHFASYPIPTDNAFPFGLVIGNNHTLWFTEAGSNKIGMLQL